MPDEPADLFDEWRQIPSRTEDPDTSRAAEKPMRAGTQRHLLLTAYADWGMRTDEEAAAHVEASEKSCWWKRCSELREGAFVEPVRDSGGEIVTRVSSVGEKRMVCRLTEKGARKLAELGTVVDVKTAEKTWWERLSVAERDAIRVLYKGIEWAEHPAEIRVLLLAVKRFAS
jgi:hypothetical protein